MKKTAPYIIGAMLTSLILSLPAEAAENEENYSAVSSETICSETADGELQADTANRSCELAMDTEDAILTGILGAAVIGAAVIAANDHHHCRETVVVEQAPPPPPPPAQTIVVHETTPHSPRYHSGHYSGHHAAHHGSSHVRHNDQRYIGRHTPPAPKSKTYENRHNAGHNPKHAGSRAQASPRHKAHESRHSNSSKARR